jgi:hypothetical protein
MKYKIFSLLVIIFIFPVTGCAPLMRAFTVDSPRPNRDQIQAAQSISEANVPIIANMQTDKQNKMLSVATSAFDALSKTQDSSAIEGITNIAANAIDGIKKADGTAKILGANAQTTMQDILHMSTAQYLASTAAQVPVALHNQEELYSGVKASWQWTKSNIGMIGGLATLIPGLGTGFGIALNALGKAKDLSDKRSQLLVNTAGGIETWKKSNPAMWDSLKPYLTEAHSQVPLNVKKEMGLS